MPRTARLELEVLALRIALISDLHANLVALEAVIDDIRHTGVDRIVCLGDVATLGPRPREVLEMLRELDCPCIMGNHDAFMLEPELVHSYTEAAVVVDAVDWCRERLSAADLEFLRSFQPGLELDIDADASILLYHGTPWSHMEELLATTPAEVVDRVIASGGALVYAGGHTHLQMLRQHRGRLVVNPGSVGLPFQEYVAGRAPTVMAHAEYALVEVRRGAVDVRLKRVVLDRAALRASVAGVDFPLRSALLEQYR